MSVKENKMRARRAWRALRTEYRNDTHKVVNEDLIDCLADLRHLCDRYHWSFGDLDRIAYDHYIEESATARRPA